MLIEEKKATLECARREYLFYDLLGVKWEEPDRKRERRYYNRHLLYGYGAEVRSRCITESFLLLFNLAFGVNNLDIINHPSKGAGELIIKRTFAGGQLARARNNLFYILSIECERNNNQSSKRWSNCYLLLIIAWLFNFFGGFYREHACKYYLDCWPLGPGGYSI